MGSITHTGIRTTLPLRKFSFPQYEVFTIKAHRYGMATRAHLATFRTVANPGPKGLSKYIIFDRTALAGKTMMMIGIVCAS